MRRFAKFCIAGTIAFLVDAGIVTALTALFGMDPYVARILSFLAAATTTWAINRRYTFEMKQPPSHGELAGYVVLMLAGAAVNYGAYAACITFWPLAREHLWLAVAIGSMAGLVLNYLSARALFGRVRAAG